MTAAAVRTWIDEHAEEMADLLIRLVAVASENPPGHELAACAEVLRTAMHRLGLAPEVIEIEPSGTIEDPRIVRGTAGHGEKLVYFHGHFDVVPAHDRHQFTARRRDGTITGRGTADMKGGLVSMLYAAAAARDLGMLDNGRVVLHLVCDEETGSDVGSGHLHEHGLLDPDALAMLTAEQSGEAIWHAAKGALSLRIDVHGRPVHVGQAFRGVNSFLHMLNIAAPLEHYADEMSRRHTEYAVGEGEAPGTMIVVGGESGGGSHFNVVPALSHFTVDGRFNPEEDLDAELARVTALIEDAARDIGAEIDLRVTQFARAASTPLTDPVTRLLGDCVTEVTGVPARYELCSGCLDTRWYHELGIPAFGFGPGRFDLSHSPHEYVDEAALHRVAVGYALFAGCLLG